MDVAVFVSQRGNLDELSEQLNAFGQRVALQRLRGDPVLHLAAALQYQLQVEGAPAGLFAVEHVTHKFHLRGGGRGKLNPMSKDAKRSRDLVCALPRARS